MSRINELKEKQQKLLQERASLQRDHQKKMGEINIEILKIQGAIEELERKHEPEKEKSSGKK